jgi:RNA polymerase sigma-70 factor (ECF subfamily)
VAVDSADTISGLLARARAGDRAALDRLFAACRNYALLMARTQLDSWVKVKVDPSDLVQQTLLEAYREFGAFHGRTEAEWLAWLRRILTHNAADFARHYGCTDKRRVSREVPLDGPGDDERKAGPTADGPSPSDQLLLHERELLLADALAQLTPDYHEVIVLRNLQSLSFEEVAQRMGRTRPAVQMLWMRALRKLHSILEETMSGSRV